MSAGDFLDSVSGAAGQSGTTTTVAVTTAAVGDLLIWVERQSNEFRQVASITGGGTWARGAPKVDTSLSAGSEMWWCVVTTPGPFSVEATFDSGNSVSLAAPSVLRFEGPIVGITGTGASSGGATSANQLSSGPITPTVDGALLVAFGFVEVVSRPIGVPTGTGVTYTSRLSRTDVTTEYRVASAIQATAGATEALFTLSGGNGFMTAAVMAFELGASAPTITTQPVSTSATDRTTANFTTAATGTGGIGYQWLVDKGAGFVNVDSGTGGTTASYTTGTLQPAMNGWSYACDVTDDNGTTRTDTATLTVTASATSILLFRAP